MTSPPPARAVRLGPITLEAATALAPMAALTDTVFRRMVKRQGGCGFVVTEMVASEALLRGCRRAKELLRYAEEERPIGAQIMGSDPERMAEAARTVEAMGFDFVDVNMGCPARKVVSGGGGSALMRDLRLTERILDAIRRAVRVPLTIKLRAGWDDDCLNAPEVARVGEACGAELVSVHARTRVDAYRPGTRSAVLTETKRAVAVPVFANGDIRDAEGAARVMAETGCDGVMAGRGAVANPWLLREIATGDRTTPGAERARRWILDHFAILREEADPRHLLYKLKTFSGWYTKGLLRGARLRERIHALTTPEEFLEAIEEYFAAYPTEAGPEPRADAGGTVALAAAPASEAPA